MGQFQVPVAFQGIKSPPGRKIVPSEGFLFMGSGWRNAVVAELDAKGDAKSICSDEGSGEKTRTHAGSKR